MTESIETTDAEALPCAAQINAERTAMNTEELKKLAEAAAEYGDVASLLALNSSANPATILELLATIDTLTAQRDAAIGLVAVIREAVSDSAYHWQKYVVEDTAPDTLEKHLLRDFDAAIAASEGGKAL